MPQYDVGTKVFIEVRFFFLYCKFVRIQQSHMFIGLLLSYPFHSQKKAK